MNVVPTLDQLAADPAKAQGLPRQVLLDLAVRALQVHAAVTTALIAAPADLRPATEDRLITTDELRVRLGGVSRQFVYDHRREWPFTIESAGLKMRFSLRGFEAWLAQQDGRAVASPRATARRGA